MTPPAAPRGALAGWLAACALLLAIWPGRIALLDPDEARYAAAAREMLQTGDPIVVRYNGEPRLNKPPLLTWLQAATFRLIGVSEAAARLPSIAAGIATLLLVGWWARLRLGAEAAGPAAAALATCLIFFACARLAITDMLLTLWITACLLLWHESAAASDDVARRRLGLGAALACGLAVLTKGPVGLALPAIVIVAVAAVSRAPRCITIRGVATGLAGILLVAGPWAAGLAGRIGAGGVIDILWRETGRRLVGGLDHPRPYHYLLLSFWVTFLPWSITAPAAIWRRVRSASRRDAAAVLPVTWLAAVLVLFSIPADKNDAYLLPAAPALALLVASTLRRRTIAVVAAVAGILLAAAPPIVSPALSRQRSLKEAVVAARPSLRDGDALIAYRIDRPSLVFYGDRRVRVSRSGRDLRQAIREAGDQGVAVVMTDARHAGVRPGGPLADLAGTFDVVGRQAGYVVVRRGAISRGQSP